MGLGTHLATHGFKYLAGALGAGGGTMTYLYISKRGELKIAKEEIVKLTTARDEALKSLGLADKAKTELEARVNVLTTDLNKGLADREKIMAEATSYKGQLEEATKKLASIHVELNDAKGKLEVAVASMNVRAEEIRQKDARIGELQKQVADMSVQGTKNEQARTKSAKTGTEG